MPFSVAHTRRLERKARRLLREQQCFLCDENEVTVARAEAPGMSAAREKAEAVPVESVAPVAEIDDFLICIVNRKKTADNFKFL